MALVMHTYLNSYLLVLELGFVLVKGVNVQEFELLVLGGSV